MRDFIHGAHVLPVDRCGFETEGGGAAENRPAVVSLVVRVLVVQIVFADVDDGQLPELRQVHDFVERSLAQRAFTEKADSDAAVAQPLRGEGRARGDSDAAADNRIRAQIAGRRVGDVHRSAFAAAVAGFFAEQLCEHAVG